MWSAASAAPLSAGAALTSFDFESYPTGPGALVTNPPTGVIGFSGRLDPSYLAGGGAGDPIDGIAAESPLGTGHAAYLGGDGTNIPLPDERAAFSVAVFSGSAAQPPVNLIGTAGSRRRIALDFLLDRHDGTNAQAFSFYVYDAKDAADDATCGFHSCVRIDPDNSVSVADHGFDSIPTDIVLQSGIGYQLELTVDYDHAVWSATIRALDGSAEFRVASDRPVNSDAFTLSGWTTPERIDIEMSGAGSASDHAFADRLYFDNLRITSEADSRPWHEQTVDDASGLAPERTIPDGLGGIYLAFTIEPHGPDMHAGRFAGQLVRLAEEDGRRDLTFQLDGSVKNVEFVAVQPDHKLLLAATVGDASTVLRVDDVGAVDPTFHAPFFDRGIRFLTVQPDGKVLVCAVDIAYAMPGAVSSGGRPAVYRLNDDGSLDSSFMPAVLDEGSVIFAPPVLDAQNRIYLAGSFYSLDGVDRLFVARLAADGTLDPAFADPSRLPSGFNGIQARGIGLQSDGSAIVIGGFFHDARGSRDDAIMAIRFKSDGTFDGDFAQPLRSELGITAMAGAARMRAMQMLPDGKFLGVSDRLIRFNADGTVDSSFVPAVFNHETYWVSLGSDGCYYVPTLTGVSTGGTMSLVPLSDGGVAKITPEGGLVTTFTPGGWGRAAFPTSARVLPDGSGFIGGVFNRVGSTALPGIVRLQADGGVAAAQPSLARFDGEPPSLTSGWVADAGGEKTFALWQEWATGSTYFNRLDPDGVSDDTFNAQLNDEYTSQYLLTGTLDLTSDFQGRPLITRWDMSAQAAGVAAGMVRRFNVNGALDPTFQPDLSDVGFVSRDGDGNIDEVAIGQFRLGEALPDGRLLTITTEPDLGVRVRRLLENGARDGSFAAPAFGWADVYWYYDTVFDGNTGESQDVLVRQCASSLVNAVQQMSTGQIYVAGSFQLDGSPRGLARLTRTGAIDPTFAGSGIDGTAAGGTAIASVLALATDDYRRLYFAGMFDRFNGTPLPGLARLKADGSLDTGWQPGLAISGYPEPAVSLQVKNNRLYVFGTVRDADRDYPDGLPRAVDLDIPETAPTITAIADAAALSGVTTGWSTFVVDDAETPVADLQVSATSADENLVPVGNIEFSGQGADRKIRLTPAAGHGGTATVTVTVSDGELTASTSFTVTVNAPPTISAIANQTTEEDTATSALAFTVSDAETAATALTVTRASSNPGLIPTANIVLGGSGANRTVRITPAANASGSATITLTVSDGSLTASTHFTVAVTAVNDAPAISVIANQTTAEDIPTGILAFTVSDGETAASALTVTRASSNPGLIPTANIVLGGSGANRTVRITPAANASGSATITLTVSDGSLTASTHFTVSVTAVNDRPTITKPADIVLAKGTNRTITFTIGDTETATMALTVTRVSSNPALLPVANLVLAGSGANRTLKVTPGSTQTGTATVTLTVADASNAKATTNFKVTVANAPAIATIADQTTNEDTTTGAIAVKLSDADTSTSKLTLAATSSNATLVPDNACTFSGSGANRTLKIKPAANRTGTATITLTVSDGLLTANRSFKLTVKPVNDHPTITAIANQTTNKNVSTKAITFKIGDVETYAANLVLSKTSSNSTLIPAANIVLGGSGANRMVTLKPATNKTGTANITLTVSDGSLTASTSFTVTVNAPPTISAVADQTVAKNKSTAALKFTIGDPETTVSKLKVSAASSNAAMVPGTGIVLGGSGASRTVKVTPAKNQTGRAEITLTVSDGSATAHVSFTVTVR